MKRRNREKKKREREEKNNISALTKKKWFIWERHRDVISIPVKGSGASRSYEICLKPEQEEKGGKKRLPFHFKRNISNPAAPSLWSRVKLKISASLFFFLLLKNDKGYFKAVFFSPPWSDSGWKMKKAIFHKHIVFVTIAGFFSPLPFPTLFTANTFFIQITSRPIFLFSSISPL